MIDKMREYYFFPFSPSIIWEYYEGIRPNG